MSNFGTAAGLRVRQMNEYGGRVPRRAPDRSAEGSPILSRPRVTVLRRRLHVVTAEERPLHDLAGSVGWRSLQNGPYAHPVQDEHRR